MVCNFQAQGETTFAQKPSETYRYSVTVADNRLCIWVEERSTKLQWSSNELTRGQYLTMENVIPGATIEDYAKHFEKCLCPQLDEVHSRTLTTEVGGSFQLELTVKLRLFENFWPVVYAFKLLSSVEHRLAALEEQVRALQRGVADQTSAFLQVAASTKKDDLRLLWTGKASEDFAIKDTNIEFRRPGLYHISVVLNHTPVQNLAEWTELWKGPVRILMGYCSYSSGKNSSTTLSCATQVDEGDAIAVVCGAELRDTSYLTAVRLGE